MGGIDLRADVHVPSTASERHLAGGALTPALLWIHGGALIAGRRSDIDRSQLQRYLEAGWAVIAVDYRLAPETRADGILSDVRAAWEWLATDASAQYRLNPACLAMVGHSAGGYLALACGPRVRPRPRAIVAFYGYGDIAGPWYTQPAPAYLAQPRVTREEALDAIARTPAWSDGDLSGRMRFYVHCRQYGSWPREVAWPDLGAFSPERHVTADHPPTLLLHGEDDDDVPVERSVDMAAALAAAGVEHALIRVPGLGHGFDAAMDDPTVADAFERVLGFLSLRLR